MLDTLHGRFKLSVLIFIGAIVFMIAALLAESSYNRMMLFHPSRPDITIPTPSP